MNEPSTSTGDTTSTTLSGITKSAPTPNSTRFNSSSDTVTACVVAATTPVPPDARAAAAELTAIESDCADGDHDDSDPENDEFFFESDHLALRGNADYTAVLRTLAILQTQRMQVTRNIDQLAAAERRALDDPVAFVRQLQKGTVSMPGAVTVAELPTINFDKYGVSIPDFVPDAEAAGGVAYGSNGSETQEGGLNSNSLIVRGRMFDQTKPETFNQLWTCEEQKRLEELLIEYPPEPIEMRRFAKIARALGNRTTKQVASRLQKFFKKLHSAGMPVPGRIPKSNRQYVTKAHRMHKQALRSTTFFPANQVPYHIADEEDDAALAGMQLDSNWYRRGCYEAMQTSQPRTQQEDADSGSGGGGKANARRTYVVDGGDAEDDAADDENVKIVRLAMRIKSDKEQEMRMEAGTSAHIGFKVNHKLYVCDTCFFKNQFNVTVRYLRRGTHNRYALALPDVCRGLGGLLFRLSAHTTAGARKSATFGQSSVRGAARVAHRFVFGVVVDATEVPATAGAAAALHRSSAFGRSGRFGRLHDRITWGSH